MFDKNVNLSNPDLTWSYCADRESGHSVLLILQGESFYYAYDVPRPEGPEVEAEFIDGGSINAFLSANSLNSPRDKMVTHQWVAMELLRQYVNRLGMAAHA